MLPAIQSSGNGEVVAVASRDLDRARQLAPVPALSYDELLSSPDVDAVYLSLVNSLHREWTEKALAAGKHVLCEKPLAMNEAEAASMAEAARRHDRLLMEGFMYRFHPRTREFVRKLEEPLHLDISFGFPLTDLDNYRNKSELGGGALLDVGSYCVNLARWILGEPEHVQVSARVDAVDRSVTALLTFDGGRTAALFASIESPEVQRVTAVCKDSAATLDVPFTSWKDPDDPYQLMVESFAESVLKGKPGVLPPEDSIANMHVLDRIKSFFPV